MQCADSPGKQDRLATAPMDEQTLLALWSDWSGDQRANAVREFGAALAAVHGNEFDHHFDGVHDAIEANRDRLAEAPATLVYGDPAQPNLFWSETGVGLIDWEIAHVGDPARELHRASEQMIPDESEHGRVLVSALEKGYRDQTGTLPDSFEERVPIYDAVWFLSRSAFFDKWVEFADEDPEEAETWVETEMDRRGERIRSR